MDLLKIGYDLSGLIREGRQEQEIDPKILGNPRNTREIYFLGRPKKTQEIKFLGFSWVCQDLGLRWYFLSWVFLFLGPRNLRIFHWNWIQPWPKILAYPRKPKKFYFLGLLGFTQEIDFLGISWVTQEDPRKGISWVTQEDPRNKNSCSCLGYGFSLRIFLVLSWVSCIWSSISNFCMIIQKYTCV